MSSLELKNLKTRLLGEVNLSIEAGECVMLSGPSGSGKTVLLRAVADLDQHEGDVLIDDQPCSSMSAHKWRARVGLLTAESQWWYTTVGEHFGQCAKEYLHVLGFEQVVMDWRIDRLSSGEKQRLALLRLLCNQPDVLLLDEPSANLDRDSRERLEKLVQQYQQDNDVAVLWVSHDEEQISRLANRHFVIESSALKEVVQ